MSTSPKPSREEQCTFLLSAHLRCHRENAGGPPHPAISDRLFLLLLVQLVVPFPLLNAHSEGGVVGRGAIRPSGGQRGHRGGRVERRGVAEPPPPLIRRQIGSLVGIRSSFGTGHPNQSRTQQVVGRLGPDDGRGRRRRRLDGEEESLDVISSLRFSSADNFSHQ